MIFRRYTCPHCGGGLSRTLFGAESASAAERQRPAFQVPLLPLLAAIIVVGLGLAFVHPALGVLGVVVLGQVIYWRYFAWLQCDACARLVVSGQLGPFPRRARAWTREEVRRLGRKVALGLAIFLAVFVPTQCIERATQANCDTTCRAAGRAGKAFLHKCRCVDATGEGRPRRLAGMPGEPA